MILCGNIIPAATGGGGGATAGQLWAWGIGTSGNLGDNSITSKSSPIQIGSLQTWSKISTAGENSTGNVSASVKTDGTLWTWGAGDFGQLGDGTVISKSSPIQVGALTTWSLVSCGGYATVLSIKTDGTLWGWGRNGAGCIGDGSTTIRSSPVQVGALTNWSKITIGGGSSTNTHSHAVKTDGTLWSWGDSGSGRLGDGTLADKSSPVQIGLLTTWADVDAGDGHCIALKTDGTIWTWGLASSGQLGDGTATSKSSPVQVGALTTWAFISAGGNNTAAIKTDGTLWTWGANNVGQMGDGTTTAKSSPVQIGALTNWSKVYVGTGHTVAIKTDGTLWAWGSGSNGALGDGSTVAKSSPVQVGALTNWSIAAAGDSISFGIKS